MKKILSSIGIATLLVFLSVFSATKVFADTVSTDFEVYTTGTVNGQDGWSSTGSAGSGCAIYDHAISSSLGVPGFGNQSLRISNAVTSGCFSDHTFSKSLLNEAGETSAVSDSMSGGIRQPYFESSWDFASTVPGSEQVGLTVTASPDRGDGARMGWIQMADTPTGIDINFYDYQKSLNDFVFTNIATGLDRSIVHNIKVTMQFIDGVNNDIVKVYVDGVLKHTGNSWEDYFRDSEGNPTRPVDSILFRTGGTAMPATSGKGFLIDNFSTYSGPVPLICDANASQVIVSDITTQVDAHNAALVVPHPAWTTAISGASWIYSEALNGVGSSPTGDKTFTKVFNISNTPLDSSLQIAADNMYSVSVNGHSLSTGSSATDLDNFSGIDTWNIPAAYLLTGSNIIVITVTNPANNPVGNSPFGDPNPAGLLYKLTVKTDDCVTPPAPTSAVVHIFKYVDGQQATVESVNGVKFPMFTSTYNAPFNLGPAGWAPGDIAYEASTSPMSVDSSYSAEESLNTDLVGASCDGTHPYALDGYSVGDTMTIAQYAPKTLTTPSFTGLQGDKFIIVHNKSCVVVPPVKVHILKYLNGVKADAISASGYQFPMTATWKTANLNGGVSTSGNYVLGNNHGGAADQYGADTAPMTAPADYSTAEITDSTSQVVSSSTMCVPGKYLLNGYRTSSVSFADAATATLSVVAPSFTGLSSDRFIIVDNSKCPTTGTISGMKYNDLNRNGKKDANEPGLSGWTIRLISEDPITDAETFVTSVVTGANGTYTFPNLVPGIYEVRETHQKGWKRMSKNPKDIVISAGSVVTDVNFGNAQKKKEEKEDSDKDDNREDQSGHYYGNHEKSNYEKDQGKKDHEKKSDDKDEKNSRR